MLRALFCCVFVMFALLSGCSSNKGVDAKSSRLKEAVGEDILALIRAPEKVIALGVGPGPEGKHVVLTGEKELTAEQIKVLQGALMDDANYIFDRQKRCLFIPELAFLFRKGEQEVGVVVSLICKQVKFVTPERAVLIDNDPAYEIFQKLAEQLKLG